MVWISTSWLQYWQINILIWSSGCLLQMYFSGICAWCCWCLLLFSRLKIKSVWCSLYSYLCCHSRSSAEALVLQLTISLRQDHNSLHFKQWTTLFFWLSEGTTCTQLQHLLTKPKECQLGNVSYHQRGEQSRFGPTRKAQWWLALNLRGLSKKFLDLYEFTFVMPVLTIATQNVINVTPSKVDISLNGFQVESLALTQI